MEIEKAVFRLTDALIKDKGLQALADIASEELNKPVWIVDHDFNYLVVSDGAAKLDSFLEEAFSTLAADPEGLEYIHRKKLVDIVNSRTRPYAYYDEVIGRTVIVAAIKLKSVVAGYISTCETEDVFDETQIEFFGRARDIAALEFRVGGRFAQAHKTPMSGVLNEMLIKKCENMEHIRARMKALKFRPARKMRVLTVFHEGDEAYPWYAVESRVTSIFPAYPCTQYDNRLVFLINSESMTEGERGALLRLLRAVQLHAALSYGFGDASKAYRAYCETKELGTACLKAYPEHSLYKYDDFVTVLAAWYLREKLELNNIAGGAIEKLRAYDERYRQEALDTLEAFAQCAFNIKRTSEYLHIHNNTMRYRAERLAEITGIDFEDAKSQMQLMLALTLSKFD